MIEHLFQSSRAINLVAALIAILPNAIVLIRFDIARHFHEVERNAHLRILCVESQCRNFRRAGWSNTPLESTQTVFSAWPLAQGELTGYREVCSPGDMTTVLIVVEPLPGVGAGCEIAVNVLDVGLVRRVNGDSGSAFLICAELELAVALAHAVGGCVVVSVASEA